MRLGRQTRRMLTRRVGRAWIVALALSGLIAVALSGTRIAAQIRPAPAPVPAPVPDRPGVPRYLLRHLPQPETAHRRTCARPSGHDEPGRQCGGVGEGDREASGRLDAAPGRPRPDAATYRAVASAFENEIDRAWAANPNPGRINAVHRLNRAEYNNAIRDLFALDFDVKPLLPGDETADGSFDNFADVALDFDGPPGALHVGGPPGHAARDGSASRQPRARDDSRFRCTSLQDDRQSEDLPFGSRGGIAIHYDFPVDGEYLIKVRLQRQYQDYLKGMGWPQQLDVRLDGKLLKRFTVGGGAKGRPAAASYAGDGEPGFAGDPEWEKYMQLTGDAGLEVRVPVEAGPRVVGVSFVRELWEPEGLPQPLQRGRVIANDQVYMDYANVGSVQIGGPYRIAGAGEGHAQPPRDFRLPAPELACGRAGLRDEDSFAGWPGSRIAGR